MASMNLGGWIGAMALIGVLAACGQSPRAGGAVVRLDGSSTVFPLSEAAAESFSTATRGRARVTVGKRHGRGLPQVLPQRDRWIAASPDHRRRDRSLRGANVASSRCRSRSTASPSSSILAIPSPRPRSPSCAEWEPAAEGVITNWSQLNPAWPDVALQLYGAGTASGTFDFFTEAVVGVAKSSRTDYTPTEDDNVTVLGVAGNPGAIGYFGLAYYEQNRNRLKALSIDTGAGVIAPSAETVADGSYPFSRPLFIYVNAEALRRPSVRQFVLHYLEDAHRLAPEVGYIALPETAYAAYAARVRAGETGTRLWRSPRDRRASVEDVLARPLSNSARRRINYRRSGRSAVRQ